jgi:hypothetical protein
MSYLIVEKLHTAIANSHSSDRDPNLIRAEELGVLSGLLASLMIEYPGIKKDMEYFINHYENRKVA